MQKCEKSAKYKEDIKSSCSCIQVINQHKDYNQNA